MIAGQGQLVPAAGAGALDRADPELAGLGARGLVRVARLVGELAEVDLVGMGSTAQHPDVGTGAEHAVLAGLQDHHLDRRMLEAQPLADIGQLDVDAQVIGVQLQFVTVEQPALLVHVHEEVGPLAVDLEPPVAIR